MDVGQLRKYIIRPVLEGLRLYSKARENLLVGTAGAESNYGQYIKQIGGGPALGIYQMEPGTHDSIWVDYLAYRIPMAKRVAIYHCQILGKRDLIGNMFYATAMAAIKYYWSPDALPAENDIQGMAEMWKKVYNTPLGKGKAGEFIEKYRS